MHGAIIAACQHHAQSDAASFFAVASRAENLTPAGSARLLTCMCWLLQVFVSVPACIQLLEGPYLETNDAVVKSFRPAGLVRAAKQDI